MMWTFYAGYSQDFMSGFVLDKNKEPIPFVHIQIENTQIGTITNESGAFKIYFAFSSNDQVSVIISAIGYKTKIEPLETGVHIIVLEEDIHLLKPLIITPIDHARELVENAIKSIPSNYPEKENHHIGFLREKIVWESRKSSIYITESVVQVVKGSYQIKNTSGKVKLIESRKYESPLLDTFLIKISAGAHHSHRFDAVARREGFLGNPKNYTFEIIDTTRLNGKNLFKIKFQGKTNPIGYVHIVDSSYAIAKVKFGYNASFPLQFHGRGRNFLDYEITYEESWDKKWRYKQSKYETGFETNKQQLNLFSEYVVTEVKADQEEIPYLQQIHLSDILLDESKDYNPNFWKNHNIILPDEAIESLFESEGVSGDNSPSSPRM